MGRKTATVVRVMNPKRTADRRKVRPTGVSLTRGPDGVLEVRAFAPAEMK